MEHGDDDDDVVFDSGEDEIGAMPPIEPHYTSRRYEYAGIACKETLKDEVEQKQQQLQQQQVASF